MTKRNELYIFPTQNKKPVAKYAPQGLYSAKPESEWEGSESEQWGAPCGEKNGFFVVDVDAQHGGIESAKNINWGDTLIVPTPSGGYHVFYKYTKEFAELKNAVSILPGIDLRSNGGYVVLYDAVARDKITECPKSVVDLLQSTQRGYKSSSTSGQKATTGGEVLEGGRNAYLTKCAGRMQRLGVLTLAALKEKNETECVPPLDDYEVELIFNSVSRYDPESLPHEDSEPQKPIIWVGDLVKEMFEFLRDKGKTLGESTGVDALDSLLGGGKRLGELTVTMAEAKSGKNTFYHFQQHRMLDRGVPIGYASRELSPETEVLPNLLTLKLGKNVYKEDVTEEEVIEALKDWKLAFAPGYGQFQGDELFTWMDECRKHGVQYFFIDHLHYCLADAEDFKLLSEFGRKLKAYTKTHQIHIDLIIQPKVRQTYKQGDKLVKAEMDINMLRGGASLGQVLDSLITMDRLTDKNGALMDVVKVELRRARSKLSRPGVFYMAYDFRTMSFRECDNPQSEEDDSNDSVISDDVPVADRKNLLTNKMPKGYARSKSGEFFDVKKRATEMLAKIKAKQDEQG